MFKNFDIKGYLEDLQKLEIEKEIEGMDLEEAAEILNTRITEVLDKYAPKKLTQNRNNYCPALTEETKKDIKVRNFLRNEVYIKKEINTFEDYKKQVIKTRKMINLDNKNYLEAGLSRENSSKNAWRLDNNLMGKKNTKTPEKLIIADNIVTDPTRIAEIMNTHFTEKVQKTKKETNESPDNAIRHLEGYLKTKTLNCNLKLKEASIEQIREKIKKMKGGVHMEATIYLGFL